MFVASLRVILQTPDCENGIWSEDLFKAISGTKEKDIPLELGFPVAKERVILLEVSPDLSSQVLEDSVPNWLLAKEVIALDRTYLG